MSEVPLVSVIIPCYNAERWIAEAIDSCLRQSYSSLDVIVVDDGSTDRSLEIIESYRSRIRYETGENKGGNHARNRGFSLSEGKYIQFLDADDYILPEKIERQVRFIEEMKADVVYGDWRHCHHFPDGSCVLADITVTEKQSDILESMLRGWWVAPHALLYHRNAVVKSGGWDESLRSFQDFDFLASVVMSGADVRYQSGCYAVYRRHGNETVSTSNPILSLKNAGIAYEKVEAKLKETGRLTSNYSEALAIAFFRLARSYYDIDRGLFDKYIEETLRLDPSFNLPGSWLGALSRRLLGIRRAEGLASWKRKLSL